MASQYTTPTGGTSDLNSGPGLPLQFCFSPFPSFAEMAGRDVLVLFDVDGTLTPSRLVIKPDMKEFLLDLKKKVVIGECWGD